MVLQFDLARPRAAVRPAQMSDDEPPAEAERMATAMLMLYRLAPYSARAIERVINRLIEERRGREGRGPLPVD